MIQPISKAEIRYGDTNQGYVTLRAVRNDEGKMDITIIDAFFRTASGEELVAIIADFKSRVEECDKEQTGKTDKPKTEPRPRRSRCMFNEQQQAEIIKRYKAGEGPTAISASLGCSKSVIVHLLSRAGVTEGRTGAHLRKPKPEPQPEPEEKEPV